MTFPLPEMIDVAIIGGGPAGLATAIGAASKGIGADFVEFAVGIARAHGCSLVQLTSDVRREDAHRFYERLGFQKSHCGFKRELR